MIVPVHPPANPPTVPEGATNRAPAETAEEVPETDDDDQANEPADSGPTHSRFGRRLKPNPNVSGPQWVKTATSEKKKKKDPWIKTAMGRNPTAKVRTAAMNNAFLHKLSWNDVLESLQSHDCHGLLALMELTTDFDLNTIEDFHPLALAAKANAEDNPTWEEAMNGPFKEGFREATDLEIETLKNKEVWEEVNREPWMNVLPSTWAFKIKRYPDGLMRKLKARFCVRGDKQIEGVDYFDTFAPVVNWNTVRLLLILSVLLELKTKQIDYTAAFVHAPINTDPEFLKLSEEEQRRQSVYVECPRGYPSPGKVLKLKKSLYGLRQAPRNWFQHLKKNLEAIGFNNCEDVDPCLFVSDKVICLVYVDDTLLYSEDSKYIDEVIAKLRLRDLELEEEDDVAGFLGVDIHRRDDGTIKLSQSGLAKRIIEALGIQDSQKYPVKYTPADGVLPMDPDGDPPNGNYSYASIVGMLSYLDKHSRPDLSFAVSQCARYTHSPKRSHEIALEHIGQYLKGTIDEGIILKPKLEKGKYILDVDAYVDADFAGLYGKERTEDPSCAKSRTGFVICLANCPIIWSSKLQPDIALSTMQSEYQGLSMMMRDLLPFLDLVKTIAKGVGLSQDQITKIKTTVWEDNIGALTLAQLEAGQSTSRSKHYAIKYHWFRSQLKPEGMNKVVIDKIDTKVQRADLFTKALPRSTFEDLRKLLLGW